MPFSHARPPRACLRENLELFTPLFDFRHWKNMSGEPTLTLPACRRLLFPLLRRLHAGKLSPSTSVEWWPVGCPSYHYVTQWMWASHVKHVTTHQRHASSIPGMISIDLSNDINRLDYQPLFGKMSQHSSPERAYDINWLLEYKSFMLTAIGELRNRTHSHIELGLPVAWVGILAFFGSKINNNNINIYWHCHE